MDDGFLTLSGSVVSGIPDVDGPHRELIDLYNRIVWACEHDETAAHVRERVRSFLMYARWHFHEEEERMRLLAYPEYDDHHRDHGRLLQDAEDFVASLGDALRRRDAPAVARYFRYWLSRHMASHDAKLSTFIAGSINDTGVAAHS
jgi:hemerythrin